MLSSEFDKSGFSLIQNVLADDECVQLGDALEANGSPGSRCCLEAPWCSALARRLRQHSDLGSLIPHGHAAVQCTYFEKSATTNWLVPAHQDLSIPVAERISHPQLSGWSQKEGLTFVQPPVEVLQTLVAIRVHIDDCGANDGPLRVVPGSHMLGRVPANLTGSARSKSAEVDCITTRGSVLAMRPLLLHSSSKANGSSRRRILHFLYGPRSLPHGLQWRSAV